MARNTASKSNTKTGIGYLRVSTEDQNLGPEAQRASIEAWAARTGVAVVAWFEDHGVSGAAELDRRPALMSALDALAATGAGVLVVAKRDRLARDVVLAAMIERLAARNGARVVSAAGEGTDADDPSSMLMRTMIDAFAAYERAIIRARTKSALAVKKARGERTGTVPFGYSVADNGIALVSNVAEQSIIARVREARARGVTFRAIVAELEAAGLVGRTGRSFGLAQVAGMVAA